MCCSCVVILANMAYNVYIIPNDKHRRPAVMASSKANIHIRVSEEQKKMLTDLANDYEKSITDLILMMAEYVRDTRPTFQVKSQRRNKQPVASDTEGTSD